MTAQPSGTDEMENKTAPPPDHTEPPLWEADAFAPSFPLSLGSDQQVGPPYAMPTQPYLTSQPLPAMQGFPPPGQAYVSPYFAASSVTTQPPFGFSPPPAFAPLGQQSSTPTASQDPAARRRTTCPVCSDTKGSARDLDRHLWTHHRDYAVEHRVRSEERQCPHPHCTYVGRKDNLSRHIKARHKSS